MLYCIWIWLSLCFRLCVDYTNRIILLTKLSLLRKPNIVRCDYSCPKCMCLYEFNYGTIHADAIFVYLVEITRLNMTAGMMTVMMMIIMRWDDICSMRQLCIWCFFSLIRNSNQNLACARSQLLHSSGSLSHYTKNYHRYRTSSGWKLATCKCAQTFSVSDEDYYPLYGLQPDGRMEWWSI